MIRKHLVYAYLSMAFTAFVLADTPANSLNEDNLAEMLSLPFIRVAETCSPAVVHIYGEITSNVNQRQRGSNPYQQWEDDFIEKFFGAPPQQQKRPQGSVGSGFFVSDDGYILTNYHVVQQAQTIYISREGEGVNIQADLIGFDQKSDLAVLKIDTQGEKVPFLKLGDSDKVRVGQWVVAIGSPFELRNTVTTGTVSATHRNKLQLSQIDDFIQVDAAINPGNSGGPLLNLQCEVLGINTAIFSQGGGSIGLGFAIPSNMIRMVFEHIRDKGIVDRGFIGVQLQELTSDLAIAFKLPNKTMGVVVADVTKDSPGEKAGLQAGDVITSIDGKSVNSPEAVIAIIGNKAPGDTILLEVIRSGKKKSFTIVLGSQAVLKGKNDAYLKRFGMQIELLTPEKAYQQNMRIDESGMIITNVLPNSKAAKAGLRRGMVVLVVNGKKIRSYEDLTEALEHPQEAKKHIFLVNYQGRASFHSVDE